MRKIAILVLGVPLLAVMLALGCKKDKNKLLGYEDNWLAINIKQQLSGTATSPAVTTYAEGEQKLLTPAEIVRLPFIEINGYNEKHKEMTGVAIYGFDFGEFRDYKNNRFLLDPTLCYDAQHGGLQTNKLLGCSYIVVLSFSSSFADAKIDTVAYIPRAALAKTQQAIKDAFAAGEYDKMYSLFQDGYNGIPCTGKQFREMRKNDTY